MSEAADLLHRATLAYRGGDLPGAERLCRAIVAADPASFGAHHLLALIAAASGRHEDALAQFDAALAVQPDNLLALANRGGSLVALGRFAEALASYDRALLAAPLFPDALASRGAALTALGRPDEALASCDKALALSPGHPVALANRAKTLHDLQRFGEALAAHDMALAVRPDDPQLWCNRGASLHSLDRHEEALADYAEALARRPHYPEALSNRGAALRALGRFDEALASCDAALARRPDYPACRANRARLLLQTGSFADGWREYEWRRSEPGWPARANAAPEWRGDDLLGRRVLLYAEQGLGDTIQFARFAASLAEQGAEAIVEVQPALRGLLQTLRGARQVTALGERPTDADYSLPLMSVPFVLGLDETRIPAAVPYLDAEPARVAAWARHLPAAPFRVGIAWQGNPTAEIDRGRSIPLAAFAPLCGVRGARLVSLQKRDGIEQLAALPPGMAVTTLGDDFDAGPDAFLDTAAVMMHLDLVVTSDSAVAHLAGALGRPVWIVLKAVPDWRWLLGRSDTPWYPTARLFRQRRPGDWADVFARVARELATVAAAGA